MARVIQAYFAAGAGVVQARGRVAPLDAGGLQLGASVGRPLPSALRAKMEAFFHADFSDVRIHQGPQAQSIGAHAFTMGSGIWFAPGRYAPDTRHGQQLIGHELAHVVQQRAGRVRSPGPGLVVVNDAALEAEADRLGAMAAATATPVQAKMHTRPVGTPLGGTRTAWPRTGFAAPARAHPIQRSRDIHAQAHDYIVPPQPDWYRQHVTQRVTHFVTVILKVWHVVHTARNSGPAPGLRRMGSAVSANAEAQVGQGNYGATAGKLDAAHLMNTTVRANVLLQGWTPTSIQEEMIKDLYAQSGATTMQLKADNVGPDKVIDRCMTEYAGQCATACDAGHAPPAADTMINALTTLCLQRLQASAKQHRPNYQEAITGVNNAVSGGASRVEDEITPWLKDFQ
jgi:hypothetical protein